MVNLDFVNLRLIEMLQADARASVTELARSLHRGETTIRERIAGLEARGLVTAYRAEIDAEKLGFGVRAVLRMDLEMQNVLGVAKRLETIPNVTGAWLVSGSKPLRVEVVARSLSDLEDVIEHRIAPLPITGLETSVFIRALVPRRPLRVVPVVGVRTSAGPEPLPVNGNGQASVAGAVAAAAALGIGDGIGHAAGHHG